MEKTLLVDGDNLFKIGFHGVKEYYHNGNHIGGLFHFINALRRHLDENNFDKVWRCTRRDRKKLSASLLKKLQEKKPKLY